ncbi:MAG: chromosomal replication initiator protein DnaA [Candidatus Eremiobacteraeota bacterium]|nr:chromosomal replication initiator protein DnaA [Candidatus Eremiobacteraeota bacterium]MBC5802977.1 chromosomal replication initiator protein DnaA [Candidatus Eremiobacteraeota bacterium]MBC5822317.1 chromosomal replication initiator protein DnaA [Candidatus Eremiobacteraeota bacterium]
MGSVVEHVGVSNELWAAALAALEPRYTKPTFEMWLKPMRVIEMNENRIVLSVQSPFARDWVENRLRADIADVLLDLLGAPIDLQFVVVPGPPEGPDPAPETGHLGAVAGGAEELRRGNLNPRYRFEEFVVGNSNRFAHAASQAVAEAPAQAYNPLFLYGGVGLGKTHLMHAIGHRVLAANPGANIVYVSSEKFTNDFIGSVQKNQGAEFRDKYRAVDVLLIDDIQFIEGKEGTQEEFFHTFNALHESQKQVVISSDRPPKEIQTLESRLRSRFEWGLLTDIQTPDLETREAILRKKAESEKIPVPDDVTSFIAKVIPSNIRELEGALIRVVAYASLTKSAITAELAAEVLKNVVGSAPARRITIASIKERVAKAHGLTVKEMDHHRRDQRLAAPRQIAMYLATELTDNSLPQIAREFIKKDHTTIMYARDKVRAQMSTDEVYRNKVRSLMALCQSD